MSQGISLATFENRPAQVGEPIEHAADVEEKENELPYVRSAGNGSVQGLQTAGQAVVHPRTAATVDSKQSFPFLFPAGIVGLSQPRRLLGPVFDDARGHIHVGLDSGSAVLETKCVRQFPSIIPGLLFCR